MSRRTDVSVLHVDDEPGVREITAEMLEREDERFTVESASGASEAIDSLAEHEFDCVVSDYDMPSRDGVELLETVRDMRSDLPFILFTGKGSEEVAGEALRKGATDYLQKRGGTEQYDLLANRVRNAVERYETERSRRQWKRAIETATEGIALVSEDGEFLQMNDAYADAYDESPGALVGTNWREWYPGREIDRFENQILETLREEGAWEGESIGRRTDGTEFTQDLSLSMLDGGGHVCVMRDITEQKERDQQLEETTLKLESLVDAFPDIAFIKDVEGNYLEAFAGPETESLLYGGPEAYEDGQHVTDVFDEDQADRVLATIRRAVETGTVHSLEYQLDVPSGTRWFESRVAPIDGTIQGREAVVWVARDITERREREQELRQLKEEYETVFNSVEDSLFLVGVAGSPDDREFRLRRINPANESVLGVSTEEVGGKTPTEIFGEEVGSEIVANYERCLDRGQPMSYEEQLDLEEGPRTFETTLTPVEVDSEPGLIVGVAHDITERKERERELTEFEEAVDAICENVPLIFFTFDDQGEFIRSRGRALERIGFEPGEAVGQSVFDIYSDRPEIITQCARALDGERVTATVGIADGTFKAHYVPIRADDEVVGVTGHKFDVTEYKRREEQLQRQNERLDEFVSVVSHDLRNPLNAAMSWLELAADDCDSEHLEKVADAHDRMESLIENLLALAREGEPATDREPVDLAELAEICWGGLETESASLIVETTLTVRGVESRLQQLLVNLLRNAVEHADGGVTVTIGDLDDGFYVADDGPGIPGDQRSDVFESGYSTAEDGTGFGLPIAEEIVEAHGWEIGVTGSDAGGSRFEITQVEVIPE